MTFLKDQNDTAPDLWEGEDRDLDGERDSNETNPKDEDSDGDGLIDGPDRTTPAASGELVDKNNPRPLTSPLPGQMWSTDPLNKDSDGDGLSDGNEVGGTLDYGAILNIKTDPTQFDSDGDQLSDGQEQRGWQITIIYEKTKDKAKEYRAYSDPTKTNTDGDKKKDGSDFTDFDELQATSDPNSDDTDGDAISDGFESPGGAWQVEGEDPKIKEVKGKATIQFFQACAFGVCIPTPIPEKAFIHLDIKASDNGKLDKVRVSIPGYGEREASFGDVALGAEVTKGFDFEVSLLDQRVWLEGFDLKVVISDRAGNGGTQDVHVQGLAQQIIEALLGAFKAFVDAVVELAMKALEWIWSLIRGAFDAVLKPVLEALAKYVSDVLMGFDRLFSSFLKGVVDLRQAFAILFDHPVVNAVQGIVIVVLVIIAIVTGVGSVVGALIDIALDFVQELVRCATLKNCSTSEARG